MATDIYMEKLKDIVNSLEDVYGLKQNNAEGVSYLRADIEDVVAYATNTVADMSESQRVAKNTTAGQTVVLLCYLNHRLKYFNKSRLDYSVYPRLDMIVQVLTDLLKKATVTEASIKEINRLVTILDSIDNLYAQHKMGMAYKYLRLLIVMTIYGNYSNAGIVADFIINQIIMGVKYDT